MPASHAAPSTHTTHAHTAHAHTPRSPPEPLVVCQITRFAGCASAHQESAALPHHPDVSYLDTAIQYKASLFEEKRKAGKIPSEEEFNLKRLESGGIACKAIRTLKKAGGYCEASKVSLEQMVRIGHSPASIQQSVFDKIDELYAHLSSSESKNDEMIKGYAKTLVKMQEEAKRYCEQRKLGEAFEEFAHQRYKYLLDEKEFLETHIFGLNNDLINLGHQLHMSLKEYKNEGGKFRLFSGPLSAIFLCFDQLKQDAPPWEIESCLKSIEDYDSNLSFALKEKHLIEFEPEANRRKLLIATLRDYLESKIKSMTMLQKVNASIKSMSSNDEDETYRPSHNLQNWLDYSTGYRKILYTTQGQVKSSSFFRTYLAESLEKFDIDSEVFLKRNIFVEDERVLNDIDIFDAIKEDFYNFEPKNCVTHYMLKTDLDAEATATINISTQNACKGVPDYFQADIRSLFNDGLSGHPQALEDISHSLLNSQVSVENFAHFLTGLITPACKERVKIPDNLDCNYHFLNAKNESLDQKMKSFRERTLEELKRERATGIMFCPNIQDDLTTDSEFGAHCQRNRKKRPFHGVGVVGIRCEKGKAQYLLQNSHGKNECFIYKGLRKNPELGECYKKGFEYTGAFWIDEEVLIKNSILYDHFTDLNSTD